MSASYLVIAGWDWDCCWWVSWLCSWWWGIVVVIVILVLVFASLLWADSSSGIIGVIVDVVLLGLKFHFH